MDKRKRFSIAIQSQGINIVVDTGPDFRTQCLENNIQFVDTVLYTHFHYDHIGGMNDLRAFTLQRPTSPIQTWANTMTYRHIKKQYPYLFAKKIKNQLKMQIQLFQTRYKLRQKRSNNKYQHMKQWKYGFKEYIPFNIGHIQIKPIKLLHVRNPVVESVGFIIQESIGYLTDFKKIYSLEWAKLYKLPILILGAPQFKPHATHITIPEAVSIVKELQPKLAIIGHLGHDMTHKKIAKWLPKNIIPAYDGLSIKI